MLNESTKNYSTEAMSMALEKLGSQIYFSGGEQYLEVYVASLTKNLPATLALLEEKLLNPAFTDSDFQRLQQQTLQGLQNAQKNAGYLAQQAYSKLMFGEHISGYNPAGTLQSVSQLSVAQLQAYYQQQLKPQGSQLIVVSDLAAAELTAQLQSKLQQWQGQAPALKVQLPTAIAKAGTIYLVDKPDAPQSEIRIGKRSLTEDISGEYFRAGLMNYALGGNFNSRD